MPYILIGGKKYNATDSIYTDKYMSIEDNVIVLNFSISSSDSVDNLKKIFI